MIRAVGADLVEIARVRKLLERHGERILKRLFTEEELAYALTHRDPAPSLAARLAAKEAFQKCWPEPLSWKAVWVGLEGRRPLLRFVPELEAKLQKESLRAHLTLSHERGMALAVVILELKAPTAE
ncbi:holo-[acyl-carrier-protein] synthase [Thermus sp. LT1-2-5]|uniref:holo-ACP synthase n=1 Tax=Thermus sp. LT1-2-5 TaxID=3026935 RepID=UPI0030E9BD0D